MREGVTYKRLGEVGQVITGSTPPTKDERNYSSNDVCFFKPSDIDSTGLSELNQSEYYISNYAYEHTRKLPKGSILTTCIGIIGKVGILMTDAACNQQINAIIPNADIISSRFLGYAIISIKNTFIQSANAPVVPILTKSLFSNFFIPVPSLSTQELIVRELDSISSVISAKKQQVLELDNLAQGIFLDTFGDPITNPKGWEVKRWEDAVTIINGRNQAAVECEDGQYPICGSGGEMGRANEYLCPEFSIIIGRKGNINKPIFMREKFWNIDTAFGIVPITDIVNADYLYHFCLHFDFELLNVTVTIPSLRKADLLKIRIPLPPLSLQQAFAEKVQAIEEQKRLINQSIAEFESLLAQRMEFHFA